MSPPNRHRVHDPGPPIKTLTYIVPAILRIFARRATWTRSQPSRSSAGRMRSKRTPAELQRQRMTIHVGSRSICPLLAETRSRSCAPMGHCMSQSPGGGAIYRARRPQTRRFQALSTPARRRPSSYPAAHSRRFGEAGCRRIMWGRRRSANGCDKTQCQCRGSHRPLDNGQGTRIRNLIFNHRPLIPDTTFPK